MGIGGFEFNEKTGFTDSDFVVREIEGFKRSNCRKNMLLGERYARGLHDILQKKRTAIGAGGEKKEIENLPNNRVVDNQYFKVLQQKTNYLLGRPFSFSTDDPGYAKALRGLFGSGLRRLVKRVGEDSLSCGIGYIFLGIENGKLIPKRLPPWEIIPEWRNAEHTELDCAIRIYTVTEYRPKNCDVIHEFVEIYSQHGIDYFELQNNRLIPRPPFHKNYICVEKNGEKFEFNWREIPIIPFRANCRELPLICRVKYLQDSLNSLESNFRNVMEEDVRDSVMVLVNYDGEDLSSFRHNLAEYGVVPVRTVDGGAGDVKSLRIDVNSENYLSVLRVFKKAIIENAAGFDGSDERLFGTPNELNLRSMYSDIDLDANNMETEFQDSFAKILKFADYYFDNTGLGEFYDVPVDVIFDRDVMISESEVIENCVKSKGIISDETIIAMHPWISDPSAEAERVRLNMEKSAEKAIKKIKNNRKK